VNSPPPSANTVLNGVLLIDKPAGITSHDAVAAVRRALGGLKTGHAGTLDPFATGLLLVLVGRATKAQRQMMELRKRYETVARLGAISSTGDIEGVITETGRLPADRSKIGQPPLPTGEIRQRPPQYSAVKIGGERAYKRARRGEEFEMPERIVSVYRFEQLWRERDRGPEHLDASATPQGAGKRQLERAGYEIECSAGTYVRSLIADLNDAYCLQLRRTAIGPFDVRDAVAPPRRGEPWLKPPLIPLEEALAALGKADPGGRLQETSGSPGPRVGRLALDRRSQ
jgi:tRNA pseudouridine55 synthase